MDGEEYTAQEAARILRTTERTIRRRLERGDLDGRRDPTTGRWFVSARSVTAAMPDRPPKESQENLEAPESVRNYQERVEALQRELGRLEGRLELTETAESTLREQLERERSRADRLEGELREARERLGTGPLPTHKGSRARPAVAGRLMVGSGASSWICAPAKIGLMKEGGGSRSSSTPRARRRSGPPREKLCSGTPLVTTQSSAERPLERADG